ncbi:hypothetical protein FEM48_Zijuj10G0123000 [Ziziphus jujuba var. spinosa]|uniref:Uncharacterized protein n=1 Tax=Ziziphus jujuba var. spinosa TaxID=714518 RepID=A0A978UNC2_ZIZJJ|nr:hypothetical protein FEM48_Zijuj10G0123000 [Ziziphus jujuba var. spinosa]
MTIDLSLSLNKFHIPLPATTNGQKARDSVERGFDSLHRIADVVTFPLASLDGAIHGTARGILNWLADNHPEDRSNGHNHNNDHSNGSHHKDHHSIRHSHHAIRLSHTPDIPLPTLLFKMGNMIIACNHNIPTMELVLLLLLLLLLFQIMDIVDIPLLHLHLHLQCTIAIHHNHLRVIIHHRSQHQDIMLIPVAGMENMTIAVSKRFTILRIEQMTTIETIMEQSRLATSEDFDE